MKKKRLLTNVLKMALMLPIMPIIGIPGAGASGGSDDGAGEPGGNPNGDGKNGGTLNPFDEFLQDKNMQAEFDRRVAKGINTAKERWDKETDTKILNAVAEAQRLAKMNNDQKAEYEKEQAEKKLAKREADITRRELQATAKDILADRGLPIELFATLDYSDAETCNKSIDAVEKAFKAAVENAVDERIKASATNPKGTKQKMENKDPFIEGLGL